MASGGGGAEEAVEAVAAADCEGAVAEAEGGVDPSGRAAYRSFEDAGSSENGESGFPVNPFARRENEEVHRSHRKSTYDHEVNPRAKARALCRPIFTSSQFNSKTTAD